MEKCLVCGEDLIPDKESKNFATGDWDEHTYFPCNCCGIKDKNLRISIG